MADKDDLPEIIFERDQGAEVPHESNVSGAQLYSALRDAVPDRPRPIQGGSGPVTASLFPKRSAQVVQGSLLDLDLVMAHVLDPGFWQQDDLLWVDVASHKHGQGEHVFLGSLAMPLGRRRQVQLRIYPTPSANLTVFELLPRRKWMPQTTRYLRAGVPAITALTDRIEARPDQLPG